MSGTQSGVYQTYVLPRSRTHSAREALAVSIERAERLRGAIAFWSAPPHWISNELEAVLARADSWLTMSVQRPTDIDQAAELARAGTNLWICLGRVGGSLAKEKTTMMHSKMLVFDLPDGTAEIWCGSHNWTISSLAGANVEESVILKVEQNSPLYDQAVQALEFARDCSEPFDLGRVDLYKAVQRQGKTGAVELITLHSPWEQLWKGVGVVILLNDRRKERFPRVDDKIHLRIEHSGTDSIFVGEITQAGRLDPNDQAIPELEFSQIRYAYRGSQGVPEVHRRGSPTGEMMAKARHYFAVRLTDKLPDATAIYPVEGAKSYEWGSPADHPILAYLDRRAIQNIGVKSNRLVQVARRPPEGEETRRLLPFSEWAAEKRVPLSQKVLLERPDEEP